MPFTLEQLKTKREFLSDLLKTKNQGPDNELKRLEVAKLTKALKKCERRIAHANTEKK